MQQESKIGFLWQYVIACIHPSQYKELIKKKKGAFVGYVAVLVMFLVLIENVIPFAAWTASVGGLENLVLNRIPKFTLEKGYAASSFGNGEIITAGTSVELPAGLGSQFTYMDWQAITDPSSNQWKLKQQAGMNFDEEGFGRIMVDM